MRKGHCVGYSKVALITGVTGQDGSYLAELLLSKGYVVHGIKRRSSSLNTNRIDHIYQDPHVDNKKFILHYGDMTDSTSLMRIIEEAQPDEIYNLAAQSHVHVSFETPEYTANADAIGVTRILEAIRLLSLSDKSRFYQASTSEMYGLTSGNLLNEKSPFYPRSPYGVAKLFSYWMTVNYREAYGFYASNGILFNHESPRRGETFVTRKVVQAATRISKGSSEILYMGNLNAVRDWGHAKDYVLGMWKILQYGSPSDWVLATGQAISVREFTEKVFCRLGIDLLWKGSGEDEIGINGVTGEKIISIDKRYFRPAEVPHLRGDATKAKELLGWQPEYNIDDLIEDMIVNEIGS